MNKFRVWDSQVKKMVYFDLKGVAFHLPPDIEKNLMEETTVLDKAGVLIFEHDIVHTKRGMYRVVIWDDRNLCWKLLAFHLPTWETVKEEMAFPLTRDWPDEYFPDFKVVGNFYEGVEV